MQPSHMLPDFFNYRPNLLTKHGEQRSNVGHRTAGWSGVVANAYTESRCVIVGHVKGRRINGESHDVAAIFNFSGVDANRDSVTDGMFDANVPRLLPENGHIEQPVLVTVIKISDKGEHGRERSVPSIVRLYPLNACPHCWTQRLDSEFLPGEFVGTVGDGKLQDSLAGGRVGLGLANSNGIDEVVEGRTQTVDAISENQRPPIPIRGDREINGDTVEVTLRVAIVGENVQLGVCPKGDFVAYSFGVFFCTRNFQPAVFQFGVEHQKIRIARLG